MKPSFFQATNPKRHKLIKGITSSEQTDTYLEKGTLKQADKFNSPIKTITELRSYLQTAIELEHSTIPPYLCALYSIKEGTNQIASAVIKSVVLEEMLHMLLAANILNAIGGKPQINTKKFIPKYPGTLPGLKDSFIVDLAKFSRKTVEVFLKIEKPSPAGDHHKAKGFHTIGEFYAAIMTGLEYVNDHTKGGIFVNSEALHKRQITSEHYYGSGGVLIPVYTIKEARLAIEEIVGQGEGIDDTIDDSNEKLFGQNIEYAHYFRFNELFKQRMYTATDTPKSGPTGDQLVVDWDAVHNMKTNPKMADYKSQPELLQKSRSFNQTYTSLLAILHESCNGYPEKLMKGIGLMYQLKYKAVELMNIPFVNDLMSGPTFEYEK